MADETKNQLYDVQMPLMVQVQTEIIDLENELAAKLKRLESKWGLEVVSIDYNGDDVAIRCEVRNLKVH